MKKKKKLLGISVLVVILLIVLVYITYDKNLEDDKDYLFPVEEVIESYKKSIKQAQYSNLIFHDFEPSIEDVQSVYNIKILANRDYRKRSFIDNFEIMTTLIDDFFAEDCDKSHLQVTFYKEDEDIVVSYNDVKNQCVGDVYDKEEKAFLFGNNTSTGGYMIQTDVTLTSTWLSRNGFGTIVPTNIKPKSIYNYISCKRQIEDVELKLKDGIIKISELENKVLSYLNENFPMEIAENVNFGIGDVRIVELDGFEGACFRVRRIYKGIPFEYGYTSASGDYVDEYGHDRGEISYVESAYPDTICGFGQLNGKIVETEVITEMLPINKALDILSEKIGDNSIYDVYGIELVYRECYTSEEIEKIEEEKEDISEILKPMWKVITVNQNDDKYTLFYIDVVTGDITERFEYYYE